MDNLNNSNDLNEMETGKLIVTFIQTVKELQEMAYDLFSQRHLHRNLIKAMKNPAKDEDENIELFDRWIDTDEKKLQDMERDDLIPSYEQLLDDFETIKGELQRQKEKNHNMIRIMKERANQSRGMKCKSNGYIVCKITDANYGKERAQCYKVKIQTPFTTMPFNLRDVRGFLWDDIRKIEEIVGGTAIPDEIRFRAYINSNWNYYWGQQLEGDYISGYWYLTIYCNKPPIIIDQGEEK